MRRRRARQAIGPHGARMVHTGGHRWPFSSLPSLICRQAAHACQGSLHVHLEEGQGLHLPLEQVHPFSLISMSAAHVGPPHAPRRHAALMLLRQSANVAPSRRVAHWLSPAAASRRQGAVLPSPQRVRTTLPAPCRVTVTDQKTHSRLDTAERPFALTDSFGPCSAGHSCLPWLPWPAAPHETCASCADHTKRC